MNPGTGLDRTADHEEPVGYRVEGRVAVLTIDNPPVNVSTAAVRAGLLRGLAVADADEHVAGIVLIGAGANFISGSDLREFAGPVPHPLLPAVIAAIESTAKPVVAAISGATLGGGFELALGCDARIAVAGATVGFPEITLGMIPGAGGSQRPLRIVGPARTVELITSGKPITVEQALSEGLVDKVVHSDLRSAAIEFAHELTGKRVLRELPVRPDGPGELEHAAMSALRASGARPHAVAAVGAVLTGVSASVDRAFAHERAEFDRLRSSVEAHHLRHLFFARRAVAKANKPVTRQQIGVVGVIGAGTMGTGISRAFLEAGATVMLIDQQPGAAAAAAQRLRDTLGSDGAAHVTVASALDDLAGAALVIEAVYEDMDVKLAVLSELEKALPAGIPIGTNTSYLNVDQLAASLQDPGRMVGLHFFSPAHRTRVLEVVRGRQTARATMDMAFTAARQLGKVPIVAGVCDGFIGNRIYNAYRRQCELMLEEGALPRQVDRALRDFGFAMGPFAVSDMSGLDVAWRMRQSKRAARDPRARYPDVADQLCERGRFGQKTGAGWYRYQQGSRTPQPDPLVQDIIEASSARKGISRRALTDAEILDRALLTMANEVALILAEGMADRPSDVDLLLTLGYGFPVHQGGITCWANAQEPESLRRRLADLADVTGHGFVTGDMALLTSVA